MSIMRLAMTRWDDGGREVPVAMSVSVGSAVESADATARLKKRVGTEPHVNGATNVAIVE